MDSLLAIELRNSLATLFSTRFSSSLLFDYPTLRALTRFIDQEMFSTLPIEPIFENESSMTVVQSGHRDPLSILDEIEQLSDEEVDSLLGNESSH